MSAPAPALDALAVELHALGAALVALRVQADDTIAALRARAAAPDLIIPVSPTIRRALAAAVLAAEKQDA